MVIACVYSGQGGMGHRWQVGELKAELPELAVHRPCHVPPGQAAIPPQATLHHRRPPACSAAPRPGAYLHRDRAGARLRAGHRQEASGDADVSSQNGTVMDVGTTPHCPADLSVLFTRGISSAPALSAPPKLRHARCESRALAQGMLRDGMPAGAQWHLG